MRRAAVPGVNRRGRREGASMGNWVVIAQYDYGEHYVTNIIRDGLDTRGQALEELRAAVHTYLPTKRIVESWRRVYRLDDRASYLVVIKGMASRWYCTLRVAELVLDSTDPNASRVLHAEDAENVENAEDAEAAESVADAAVEAAAEPQDRVPPG
jgi:hypothetical protein